MTHLASYICLIIMIEGCQTSGWSDHQVKGFQQQQKIKIRKITCLISLHWDWVINVKLRGEQSRSTNSQSTNCTDVSCYPAGNAHTDCVCVVLLCACWVSAGLSSLRLSGTVTPPRQIGERHEDTHFWVIKFLCIRLDFYLRISLCWFYVLFCCI